MKTVTQQETETILDIIAKYDKLKLEHASMIKQRDLWRDEAERWRTQCLINVTRAL